MSVAVPGHDPIMFDLGTGARYYGIDWPADRPFRGTCLAAHLHWDHIQGLPFFPPLLRPGSHLDLHGPVQDDGVTIDDVISQALRPPLFPVGVRDLPGTVTSHAHGDDEFSIGDVRVMSRIIPHIGSTLGYRIEWGGASLAYLSDHQQPGVGVFDATPNALIHDAQYTPEEFERKSTWGHCTVEYACWIAKECGARTLVLFHHDPLHDDAQVDSFVATANLYDDDLTVIGAREGLTLRIAPPL